MVEAPNRGAAVHPTGVVAALRSEARSLGPAQRGSAGKAGTAGELMVEASGIGVARAARTAHRLVRAGARSLLCWGVAGALDPTLRCGDVVLASEVICQAPLALQLESMRPAALPAHARLRTSEAWRGQLQTALLQLGPVMCGPLLTTPEVVCEPAQKARLFRETGALAVDMESAAVGVVARLHGVPFMVLRVVADTATEELPMLLQSIASSQPLGPFSWVTWLPLACVPTAWPGLVRLGRRYRVARQVLKSCARQGSPGSPLESMQ